MRVSPGLLSLSLSLFFSLPFERSGSPTKCTRTPPLLDAITISRTQCHTRRVLDVSHTHAHTRPRAERTAERTTERTTERGS